jgi:hypothetical protein
MRILWTAITGLALLLASPPPAGAASLSGPPLFIDAIPGGGAITTEVFETSDGAIDVVFAEDATGDGRSETIYRQTFSEKGPRGGRSLVFQSSGTDERPVTATPAGALPLADGAMLVGYVTWLSSGPSTGLFARIIYDRDIVGGEFDLRGGAIDATGGFLLPLAQKGLVIATRSNDVKRLTGHGAVRFVRESGKIGPVKREISRRSSQIASASRYRDGFIVRYVNPDRNYPSFVKAQIYGADGRKVGPEKTLEQRPTSRDVELTRVLGLADGSIVVLRQTGPDFMAEISAEVFDGDWSLKRERTVLARIRSDKRFAAAALPGGGFVIALEILNEFGSGAGFETRRFDPDLKPAGKPLRVEVQGGASHLSIVGREQGDALVTYNALRSFQSSQTVLYGQFIDP